MIRYGIVILAIIGVFFFPWQFAAFLTVISAFFFPLMGAGIGILYDVLYFAPGVAIVPLGTLYGVILSIAMFFLRRFVHTHVFDFS